MTKVIITTESELDSLIQSSIRKVLSERQNQSSEQEPVRYLNISEAASYLKLAKQTLYQFTSERSIPFIKKGKKLYFSKDSLEKWLLEGKKKSRKELTDEYKGEEAKNG